jgi:hypothetical protein
MDRRSFVGMLGGVLPLAAFDASLRQLGWVPGENVIVELRKTRANTATARRTPRSSRA